MRVGRFASSGRLAMCIGLALATAAFFGPEASAKPSSEIGFELNKLEPLGAGCQAYFVFDNKGAVDYQNLKVEMVVFEPDGKIDRLFAMQLAPLDAKKRTVKLFELGETRCDKIGSFLVNSVLECKAASKSRKDCLGRLAPSSRVEVELTK